MPNNNKTILKSKEGKEYYGTSFYPLIDPKESDIYVITTSGDRLDILGNHYNINWRIISSVNNIPKDSIFIPPGTQLRIPTDLSAFDLERSKINER